MMKGLMALIFGVAGIVLMQGCASAPWQAKRDVAVMDGVVHTARQGETLDAIAEAYEISPQLLSRVNGIYDPNTIKPGTRLFIPGATELRSVEPKAVKEAKRDGLYHLVGPGETLAAIAHAYDISTEELQRVNNIKDISLIKTGDRLWVPRAKEVQDIEVPKVTIVTEKPVKKEAQDPRITEKIVPPPAVSRLEKTESDKPVGKTVEFPREVTTIGPEKFQWPIKINFRILRPFSESPANFNSGVDLGVDSGTPVYAAADGEVQLAGGVTDELGSGYGNHIILYHGERNNKGIRTIYAHNSENLVKTGQKVKRGDMIARAGNTGQPAVADGGILHFEIREVGKALDPMKVLPPLN
ncbi:MAG: LysM peptidoglycan-binding domain-containing M23 family metallopeptidase [Candidatus Omnitrophota bacterium]